MQVKMQGLTSDAPWVNCPVNHAIRGLPKFAGNSNPPHPVEVLGAKIAMTSIFGVVASLFAAVGGSMGVTGTPPSAITRTTETIQQTITNEDKTLAAIQDPNQVSGLLQSRMEDHFRMIGVMCPDDAALMSALDQLNLDTADRAVMTELCSQLENDVTTHTKVSIPDRLCGQYDTFADKILARHLPTDQVAQYKAAAHRIIAQHVISDNYWGIVLKLLLGSIVMAVSGLGVLGLGCAMKKG